MKNILFLKSISDARKPIDQDWVILGDGFSEYLGNDYNVEIAAFGDLAFLVDGTNTRIWHYEKGYNIADFDVVIIRNIKNNTEKAIAVAQYLAMKDVPFVDSYILTQGKGKLASAFLATRHGVPVPKTFYASNNMYETIFRINSPFEYPFIFKGDRTSKGRDNYLINSYEELVSCVRNNTEGIDMIAQEFIPNDGDMRVLVLDGKIGPVIFRHGSKGSHLNNTSQGGTAQLLDASVLDSKMVADCIEEAKIEGLQVAGVDVIINKKTNRHYVLEVNQAPQLTTGAFVNEKLTAYASMIKRMAARKKTYHRYALTVIGRVEQVEFINGKKRDRLYARIDTGAKTSSVWASNIHVRDGTLYFSLCDSMSEYYTGRVLRTQQFSQTIVASSNGVSELRYKTELTIVLKGRKIKALFTLTDRSSQVYPVLIGRNILNRKYVVDVTHGTPLAEAEYKRSVELQSKLHEDNL